MKGDNQMQLKIRPAHGGLFFFILLPMSGAMIIGCLITLIWMHINQVDSFDMVIIFIGIILTFSSFLVLGWYYRRKMFSYVTVDDIGVFAAYRGKIWFATRWDEVERIYVYLPNNGFSYFVIAKRPSISPPNTSNKVWRSDYWKNDELHIEATDEVKSIIHCYWRESIYPTVRGPLLWWGFK